MTKFLRPIGPVIFIGHLDELRADRGDATRACTFGAGVSYTEAYGVIARRWPQLVELWDRIGGEQVRNMGTIGGNIANGSPIGDTPPALIALGARLTLRGADGPREMPLEDFFVDYGKQDRAADEFVESVVRARPARGADARRLQGDQAPRRGHHRRVCGAFRLTRDGGRGRPTCALAYGGMAATPKRAAARRGGAASASPGRRRRRAAAMAALATDFTPLTDWRASADYRHAGRDEPDLAVLARDQRRDGRRASTGRWPSDLREADMNMRNPETATPSRPRHGDPRRRPRVARATRAARKHVTGARRVHRRHSRARPACCTPASACRTGRMREIVLDRPRARSRRRPAWSAC